jgi:hypothetical protein
VIRGPETPDLVSLRVAGKTLHVTETHPVPLRRGVVLARDVMADDALLGEDLAYHEVEQVAALAHATPTVVWNLRLDSDDPSPRAHALLAEGIVMGDQLLQEQVGNGPLPAF